MKPPSKYTQITDRGRNTKNNMQTNTKQPILSQLKDVYSIYGLKPIYNTFYIYVYSFCVALSTDTCFSWLSASVFVCNDEIIRCYFVVFSFVLVIAKVSVKIK